MATEIVIASAARTPIGSFNGAFGAVPAHDLGKVAITGALERSERERVTRRGSFAQGLPRWQHDMFADDPSLAEEDDDDA